MCFYFKNLLNLVSDETQAIIDHYIGEVIFHKDNYRELEKVMNEFAKEIHDITCKRMIDPD